MLLVAGIVTSFKLFMRTAVFVTLTQFDAVRPAFSCNVNPGVPAGHETRTFPAFGRMAADGMLVKEKLLIVWTEVDPPSAPVNPTQAVFVPRSCAKSPASRFVLNDVVAAASVNVNAIWPLA